MIWRVQRQPFRNTLFYLLLPLKEGVWQLPVPGVPQPLCGEHGAAEIKKLLQQPSLPSQIRMTNNSLSRSLYFGSAIFKGLQLVKSDERKYHFSESGKQLRRLVAPDESINPHQPVPKAADQQRSPGSEQQPTFSRA